MLSRIPLSTTSLHDPAQKLSEQSVFRNHLGQPLPPLPRHGNIFLPSDWPILPLVYTRR